MVFQDNNTGNKLKAPAATQTERTKVRLQVSNGTNQDELLIYTDAKASNDFDWYDSPKMSNENPDKPEISSIVGSEYLVINGLNSLVLNTALPIHFITKTSNTFTLKANQVSNLPEGIKVILSDYGTEFDLTGGAEYNFTSDAVSSTDRFSVLFKSASGTTGECCDINSNGIFVYNQHARIILNCNSVLSTDARMTIYNGVGQKLHSQAVISYNTTSSRSFEPGVYVVKVENGGKSYLVKTIIY
jgi:hypothetical protein